MVDCGVRGSALSKLLYRSKVTPEPSVAELVVLLVSLIGRQRRRSAAERGLFVQPGEAASWWRGTSF